MRVTITVDLRIEGTGIKLGGEFNIGSLEDILAVAYDWIREIKLKTGFRTTVIEKVVYNGDNDITDKVREIDERPIPDLPFHW